MKIEFDWLAGVPKIYEKTKSNNFRAYLDGNDGPALQHGCRGWNGILFVDNLRVKKYKKNCTKFCR